MIIGVPKEIKAQENRVSLLPSGAYQLIKRGHTVLVERNAGLGSGYSDEDYEGAGAKLIETHEEVFAKADLIVKVKEPLPSEVPLLRPGQMLFTYLHLAASRALTEALLQSGCTGIAYETVEVNRRLPLLEPMSEIAGRMSIADGRLFSGQALWRQRRAAGRRARRAARPGGRDRRRRRRRERRAHGAGPRRGRDHSRSGSGADALSRHHAAHGAHALLERGAPDRAAADRRSCSSARCWCPGRRRPS